MQCESTPTQSKTSTGNSRAIVYGSVCSGIEAATIAWHPLGWKPAFFSEIDNFPRTVLQHRFPHVPLHGDFTTIKEDDYAAIDLLVGGTPCQSFSVAGLRKGLADERGNLTLEFVRLAQRLRPRWLVWENVPGVLSQDRGRAFGSFLGALAECGYGFAYRVLDAQYFGVPQRRRRVFVIGYLGDWRPAAAVLFESESLRRNLTPRREARESVAVCPTLRAGGNRTGGDRPPGTDVDTADSLIATALTARYQKGCDSGCTDTLIAHALRADGFDASEDGTGRGTPLVPVTAPCLTRNYGKQPDNSDTSSGPMLVPVAFSCKDHGADAADTSPTLRAMGHAASHANAGGQVAVAYRVHGEHSAAMTGDGMANVADPVEVARCLDQNGGYATNQGGNVVAQAFAQNTRDELRYIGGDGQVVGALAAEPGMKQQSYVQQLLSVRRLTPRECERLQGFPDEYTLILNRGKPAADGPRYKALGNSMAVPCMRWIGERIQEVEVMLIPGEQPTSKGTVNAE